MKIAAVISEYNPFTKGHAYHIEETKRLTHADAVIAIMSGNFVQRGEPAIYDKQTRTRLALEGGCDVVLELPTLFALQTAELFAYGGVAILNSLNCIDYLSFGAEADLAFLGKIATLLAAEPYSFRKELQKNLDENQPFAEARANAITSYFGFSEEEKQLMSRPNSILAIEYIKKLTQFESSIQPVAIHRVGSAYDDITPFSPYISSTAVRKAIKEGTFRSVAEKLPEKVASLIAKQTSYAESSNFYDLIRYALIRSDVSGIAKISGITEGLENLFCSNAFTAKTFDAMLEAVHSKRYTRTAISRMMFNILLGITKDNVERCMRNENSLYARILGFKNQSSNVIKYISEHSSIPIITNVPAYKKMIPDTTLFDFDILASDIYKLCTGRPVCEKRPDFTLMPVILGINDAPRIG